VLNHVAYADNANQLAVAKHRHVAHVMACHQPHQMGGIIPEGRGSGMFLFTHEAALAANNPLDVEWMSGKGQRMRLTD
jgi:hypothetical protein